KAKPITFEWTLTDKMKVNSANIKTSVPGIYKIKATGSNHCSNEQEIIIPIDTLHPLITINNDLINCIKKQAILNSTTQSNIIKYSWSGPNQFSGNKSSVTVNSAGTYVLTVESPNGCQSSKIAIVDIDTIAPKAQVKFDSIDCLRKEASITVLGSLPKYTFNWNNNSGQIASNTLNWKTQKGGQYFLQLSDTINGCITIIPANIVEDSLIIVDLNLQQIFPVCGKDNGEINNFKVIGGHGDYFYSLTPNGVYTKQTKFTNLNSGSYELYVKDQQGCEFSKKFDILDIPFVVTDLPPELNLEIGELKTLNLNINLPISMIRSISWTPKIGLSCTDCTTPTINPTKDQEYTVTVIDTNGCKSTSRIRIIVIKPKAWVPNVFSPNGDLTNDWFYVQASKTESFKINHFQIFDRWGNKVFQTNNIIPNHPEQGWNGSYKSENCNPGVFVYWVELENLLGEKFILSGDVTLLR
ncbi:MAG: gliding motility-associated C-terminal domain-containing protein, partial [Saprospiraceae bacterium]